MPAALDVERLQQELDRTVAEKAAELDVPGVSVGVYHDGQEMYAFHGVTSIENPLPVDESTLFQVGSTTKTFTATAIMRLVEEGRLDLDSRVRKYVPELKLQDESVAESVKLLQLLNHSAGWAGDIFMDTGNGDDAIERFVARMVELDQRSPLGARASYNNAAVVLAGRVIEMVTGQTYEDAVRELVLEPLGLRHSFFFMSEVMTRRFAVGHYNRDTGLEVARRWNLARSSHPSGGIVSQPADLLRYARFHMGDGTANGRRILSPESLDLMKKPTYSLDGTAIADEVGISWLLRKVGGVQLVGHGGGTNGQLSAFQMVPERDFAITIMTNSTNGGRLHGHILTRALESFLGVVEPEPESLDLGLDALREFAGIYESETSRVRIELEDGRLVAHQAPTEAGRAAFRAFSGDQERPLPPPMPLAILADDKFRVVEGPAKGGRGIFVREDGKLVGVNVGGRLALKKNSAED